MLTARRALVLLLAATTALTPARAEVQTLSLYQKTARSLLVVRARSVSDSTRRPSLQVLEVIKGSYSAPSVTIVPHFEDHTKPTPWLRREVFRKGEESILFLTPYVDEFGRDAGPEAFAVLHAADGKMEIPPEGSDALLAAVRRFVAILARKDLESQERDLRGLLGEPNPLMIEAGLAECTRLRLAIAEDIPALLALLSQRRPELRAGAVALMAQVISDSRAAGRDLPDRPMVHQRISALARLDGDEAVRLSSVAGLAALGDQTAISLLEQVGREDPSQSVRYAAQVAAWRLRGTSP